MQGEPVKKMEPSNDAMLHEFNARLGESEAVPVVQRELRRTANVSLPQTPNEGEVVASRRVIRTLSRPKTSEAADPEIQRLDDDDYHPPPKRRRTTEGSKRSKSSRLPLDRVPENQQMYRVMLETRVSLRNITNDLDRLNKFDIRSNSIPWDCYFESAGNISTFDGGIDPKVFKIWSRRIKVCLERKLRRLEDGGNEEEALTCIGALSRLERVGKGMVIDVEVVG